MNFNFRNKFETAKDKAKDAAQTAAQKAKTIAEIARTNLSVFAEEDRIKKAQQELGKLYYRDYAVGEEMDMAEYLPWCRKIDESNEMIAELREHIQDLREKGEQAAPEEEPEQEEPEQEEQTEEEPLSEEE